MCKKRDIISSTSHKTKWRIGNQLNMSIIFSGQYLGPFSCIPKGHKRSNIQNGKIENLMAYSDSLQKSITTKCLPFFDIIRTWSNLTSKVIFGSNLLFYLKFDLFQSFTLILTKLQMEYQKNKDTLSVFFARILNLQSDSQISHFEILITYGLLTWDMLL